MDRMEKRFELIQQRKASHMSDGEQLIHKHLKMHGIKFEREYCCNTLFNPVTGMPLFVDFYLPDLKTAIEFDGIHHSRPIYGKQALIEQKRRDKIKNRWAVANGLWMLRIKSTKIKTIPKVINGLAKRKTG